MIFSNEKDIPQEIKAHVSNRLLGALCLGGDAVLSRILSPRPHILIACMPKSGSTFLATVLSELPGLRRYRLTPAWGSREQELCQIRLSLYNHRSYIAQHHLRNSAWTQHLIEKYHLAPVVQVRNIADCVISIRDHMRRESLISSMGYFTLEHLKLSDAELEEAIVRLVMPWYFNFYMGWLENKKALFVNYNDLVTDPISVIEAVTSKAGLSFACKDIDEALSRCKNRNTRFNVSGPGRGRNLSPVAAEALARMIDFYPRIKDDPVFSAMQ